MLKNCFLIFLLVVIAVPTFGQSKNKNKRKHKRHYDWERKFDFFDEDSRPLLEFNYGEGDTKHEDFTGKFKKNGAIDFKIGYSDLEVDWYDHIIEMNDKYVFGKRLKPGLVNGDVVLGKANADMWQLGFGYRNGYGYEFSPITIIPYYGNNTTWTKSKLEHDFKELILTDGTLEAINARLDDKFRFGTSRIAGVKFELFRTFGLNFGYEMGTVFPRHLVWKQMLTWGIEVSAVSLVDRFVDEILYRAPEAAPLINFLLKNGVSFAMHELQKKDMVWPFASESPLTYDSYKLGVSLTF